MAGDKSILHYHHRQTHIHVFGDADCLIIALEGDVDGNRDVQLADAILAKDNNGATGVDKPRSDIDTNNNVQLADAILAKDHNEADVTASENCRYDIDLNGSIQLADAILAKDRNGNQVSCP